MCKLGLAIICLKDEFQLFPIIRPGAKLGHSGKPGSFFKKSHFLSYFSWELLNTAKVYAFMLKFIF